MKIVVTGATGLIGSNLIFNLIQDEKNHVIAISRSEDKLRTVFSTLENKQNFEHFAIDLSRQFDFNILIGKKNNQPIDLIYHAASPISGSLIRKQPVEVIDTNLCSTSTLLAGITSHNAKYNANCRILIFSSSTVYGYAANVERCIKEEETCNTDVLESLTSPYSESKRMIEVMTHAYIRQYNINAVIVRISYVFGYSYYQPETAMFSFIDTILKKKHNIVIEKSSLARRDNIFIDDVISALLLLAHYGKQGETYNISSNGEKDNFIAIDEIAEIITNKANQLLHSNYRVEYLENERKYRSQGIRFNNEKMRSLGWSVETNFEDGIMYILKEYANLW